MRALVKKISLVFGLWTAYGILQAIQAHYRMAQAANPITWGRALYSELTYSYVWFLITPLIIWLGNRFRITSERWIGQALVHLGSSVVFSFATKFTWDVLALPAVAPNRMPTTLLQHFNSLVATLDYGMLHYGIVLLCYHAVDYYQRYEEKRLRASDLEAQLANAQLAALKMQLHPHFLFNTLNAIAELVHEDPEAAEHMIQQLSEFLRLTLDNSGEPEVPLRKELDFLERYLEIEKMRFEDRLRIDFAIDPNTLNARVPNLILQPLVENALRHGVAQRSTGGLVKVECSLDQEQLRMRVSDNGPGFETTAQSPIREGIGITNTRHRLERLYGGNHHLALNRLSQGGFEVTIHIPARLAANTNGNSNGNGVH